MTCSQTCSLTSWLQALYLPHEVKARLLADGVWGVELNHQLHLNPSRRPVLIFQPPYGADRVAGWRTPP